MDFDAGFFKIRIDYLRLRTRFLVEQYSSATNKAEQKAIEKELISADGELTECYKLLASIRRTEVAGRRSDKKRTA
jgi:hypothetical protein